MKTIPWWDWLLSSGPDLRLRGFDPHDRIRFTGHRRHLSPRWAQTIGMWGLREPKDIIQRIAPGGDPARSRAVFDMFKNRNNLLTRRPWIRSHLSDDVDHDILMVTGPVMLSTLAHARISNHIKRSHGAVSPGAVAEIANRVALLANGDGWDEQEDVAGMLPIEMLLRYYAVEHILAETGMSPARWDEGDVFGKAKLWGMMECDSMVALPAVALERYPV